MSEDDLKRLQKRIKVLYILIGSVVVWLAYACCCDLEFGTDGSAGVFTTALGILVTLLVAWQIWQTIASREEIKDAREAAKKANEVAKEVTLLKTEFENSLNLFAAYRASSDGLSFLLNNQHFKAFHLFATAIIDSLKFLNDQGKCAMGAFVNLDNCMDFDANDASMKEFAEKWDGVVNRLNEIEEALRNADQENKIFQAMAKHHIDEFKKAAREKGLKILPHLQ